MLSMLKELAEVLTKPLSIILQKQWQTGEAPDDWRKVNVMSLLKKGKEDPRTSELHFCLQWSELTVLRAFCLFVLLFV